MVTHAARLRDLAQAGQREKQQTQQIAELLGENRVLRSKLAELERLVLIDTLTPLYNRRHFMDILERWIWRAHRYGEDCGMLFIDVDQLKNVNDALGHLAGDHMLISVAEALKDNVRRSDVVARIGGDEFAILLEKVDASNLPGKAQKIADAVAAKPITFDGTKIQPSVSIGYTMVEAKRSPEEIIKRADKSMYANKIAKRNGQLQRR